MPSKLKPKRWRFGGLSQNGLMSAYVHHNFVPYHSFDGTIVLLFTTAATRVLYDSVLPQLTPLCNEKVTTPCYLGDIYWMKSYTPFTKQFSIGNLIV